MNRPSKERSRPKKRKPSPRARRQRRIFLFILVLAAFLLIIALVFAGRDSARREGEATIRIASGASAREIAKMLKEEDVIGSEKEFMKKAEEKGISDSLKAGLYRFQRGEPLESILEKLEKGLQAPEGALTVPEGYSIDDIAAELVSKGRITKDEYRKAASAQGRSLPLSGSSGAKDLEGFLFPSTYDIEPGTTAKSLIDEQIRAFNEKTANLPWELASKLGLTEYQVLTVASMVEREARVPEERPLVAAVIYNRLRIGMKLEVDATVQYAIGSWKEELTQKDIETDSAYNTRLYAGLPPGPICNPGYDSINAALKPAAVDYIFYVATGDEAGHHFFTASYDEFLKVKGQN